MTLRIVVVYPDLLGTYGDGGNALVLARRAQWRGIDAELIQAPSRSPLPKGDIYCLGGGEDSPQIQAAEDLRTEGLLSQAVADGAVVLAVCAGFQILGQSFAGADGQPIPGVGLLDVSTAKGNGPRAVGEIVADALAFPLPALTGFENHSGVTTLGTGVQPLARVKSGVGNGGGDNSEGACVGRIVGTYLHGPVLARNPALADVLLRWATDDLDLSFLDDHTEHQLRSERFAAVKRKRLRRGL